MLCRTLRIRVRRLQQSRACPVFPAAAGAGAVLVAGAGTSASRRAVPSAQALSTTARGVAKCSETGAESSVAASAARAPGASDADTSSDTSRGLKRGRGRPLGSKGPWPRLSPAPPPELDAQPEAASEPVGRRPAAGAAAKRRLTKKQRQIPLIAAAIAGGFSIPGTAAAIEADFERWLQSGGSGAGTGGANTAEDAGVGVEPLGDRRGRQSRQETEDGDAEDAPAADADADAEGPMPTELPTVPSIGKHAPLTVLDQLERCARLRRDAATVSLKREKLEIIMLYPDLRPLLSYVYDRHSIQGVKGSDVRNLLERREEYDMAGVPLSSPAVVDEPPPASLLELFKRIHADHGLYPRDIREIVANFVTHHGVWRGVKAENAAEACVRRQSKPKATGAAEVAAAAGTAHETPFQTFSRLLARELGQHVGFAVQKLRQAWVRADNPQRPGTMGAPRKSLVLPPEEPPVEARKALPDGKAKAVVAETTEKRPRGRPRKQPVVLATPATTERRPRGRPRKQPAGLPEGEAPVAEKRPRGRPRKQLPVAPPEAEPVPAVPKCEDELLVVAGGAFVGALPCTRAAADRQQVRAPVAETNDERGVAGKVASPMAERERESNAAKNPGVAEEALPVDDAELEDSRLQQLMGTIWGPSPKREGPAAALATEETDSEQPLMDAMWGGWPEPATPASNALQPHLQPPTPHLQEGEVAHAQQLMDNMWAEWKHEPESKLDTRAADPPPADPPVVADPPKRPRERPRKTPAPSPRNPPGHRGGAAQRGDPQVPSTAPELEVEREVLPEVPGRFYVSLAHKTAPPFPEVKKQMLRNKMFVSRKLDGTRCIVFVDVHVPGDPKDNAEGTPLPVTDVKFYSRALNEFTSLGKLRTELERLGTFPRLREWLRRDSAVVRPVEDADGGGAIYRLVIDSEVCVLKERGVAEDARFDPSGPFVEEFLASNGQIRRKNLDMDAPVLFILDVLPWNDAVLDRGRGWRRVSHAGDSPPFGQRYADACALADWLDTDAIVALPQRVVDERTLAEASDIVSREGWEGLMFRADKPYRGGRSVDLLKYKQWQDAEYTVVGMDTAEMHLWIDGEYGKHTACATLYIEHGGHRVGVGAGTWLTAERRIRYAKDPSLVVGKQITVEYFGESFASGRETASLRFPRLKCVWEEGPRTV